MNQKREERIWENRAVESGAAADVTDCESCDETLVFALRDNYHEFSVGLQTILKCLEVAEREGYVPPLPPGWWSAQY